MSVKVMGWVWDHSQAGGTDRLVLLAIADSADHDGTNAWPAVSTIARKCQVSERTVQRSIRSLVDLGELRVLDQAGGHGAMRADRRPNLYEIVMDDGATERHPEGDGVTPGAPRGDNQGADGVTPLSPNPSLDPSEDPSGNPSSSPEGEGRDDDPDRGFDVFWEAYPRRNGKKVGKAKAKAKWRKLNYENKRAAYAAALNYARAVEAGSTIARDAERFLTSKWWEDWLDGPGDAPRGRRGSPDQVKSAAQEYLERRSG